MAIVYITHPHRAPRQLLVNVSKLMSIEDTAKKATRLHLYLRLRLCLSRH